MIFILSTITFHESYWLIYWENMKKKINNISLQNGFLLRIIYQSMNIITKKKNKPRQTLLWYLLTGVLAVVLSCLKGYDWPFQPVTRDSQTHPWFCSTYSLSNVLLSTCKKNLKWYTNDQIHAINIIPLDWYFKTRHLTFVENPQTFNLSSLIFRPNWDLHLGWETLSYC